MVFHKKDGGVFINALKYISYLFGIGSADSLAICVVKKISRHLSLGYISLFLFLCKKASNMSMDKQVIESIKETLHEHLPVGGRALLFGSQARGDAHAGSDWDILIILNKDTLIPDDYDNVTYPLTILGWDLGEQINPIMYSAKEWEASRITPFYQNVVQDAVVLI